MPLQFTNTLTGRKEPFEPLQPGKVSLYVCGVTVYDHCHVGHARGAVVFDVLRRYLEAKTLNREPFQVTHVRNVTDVDDKIIDRARTHWKDIDLKAAVLAVARKYEASFHEDFNKLGLRQPHHEPHATKYIEKIVQFIENLIDRDLAYRGFDENDVYFSVDEFQSKFPGEYGRLSGQKIDQLFEGARIEPGKYKRDPLDFALWKKAKPEEPSWDSPWGPGRPGWHIECSTMSTDLLGDTFDIHGGGQDLIFPHHENEIVQARGAGKPFARYWLHNGLLTVNGQKMSKSVGNIIRIQDVLTKHSPDVLRMFFLSAHYKSPQDFTWERLEEAAHAYERISEFLVQVDQKIPKERPEEEFKEAKETKDKFFLAMDDDLNTPTALSVLYDLVNHSYSSLRLSAFNWMIEGMQGPRVPIQRGMYLKYAGRIVRELSAILGFSFQQDIPQEVKKLIEFRDEARRNKDFVAADKFRDEISELGFIVADTGGKTVVRKRV